MLQHLSTRSENPRKWQLNTATMRRMCAHMQLPGTATRCQSSSFNVVHPTGARTGAGQEKETEAHDRGRVLGPQCAVLHFSLAAFNVKCKCGQCADFFIYFLIISQHINHFSSCYFYSILRTSATLRPSQIKSIRGCGMSHQTVQIWQTWGWLGGRGGVGYKKGKTLRITTKMAT